MSLAATSDLTAFKAAYHRSTLMLLCCELWWTLRFHSMNHIYHATEYNQLLNILHKSLNCRLNINSSKTSPLAASPEQIWLLATATPIPTAIVSPKQIPRLCLNLFILFLSFRIKVSRRFDYLAMSMNKYDVSFLFLAYEFPNPPANEKTNVCQFVSDSLVPHCTNANYADLYS